MSRRPVPADDLVRLVGGTTGDRCGAA